MTAKDIANKIALLKGALKKEKNANAKKIIQKKIENLRTQAKTSNISTTALAKQLLGSTRKVANMTDAELQSAINQLKPRSEYAFLKGRIYVKGGVGVKYNLKKVRDDLERYAKPVGWRIKGANNTHRPTPTELAKAKKKGTAYYEDRPDRSDVVRPARLEDGGMMAKGGTFHQKKTEKKSKLIDQIAEVNKYLKSLDNINTKEAYEETKNLIQYRSTLEAQLLHLEDSADGGMMADGGKTQSINSKKVRKAVRGYMYTLFSSESNRMPESFFQTLTKAEEEKVDELVTPLIMYVFNSFKGIKK